MTSEEQKWLAELAGKLRASLDSEPLLPKEIELVLAKLKEAEARLKFLSKKVEEKEPKRDPPHIESALITGPQASLRERRGSHQAPCPIPCVTL